MGKRRELVIGLALTASALTLTALALEGLLRAAGINSPSSIVVKPGIGIIRVPGAYYLHTKEGRSEGHFNSHGFRDFERSWNKAPGTIRIVVLGDSMTEALQVSLDSAFPALLEKQLDPLFPKLKFEVLNLGQSGFGTADEFVRFERLGARYSPDVVILALFAGNDIRNNSRVLNTESLAYYFDFDGRGQLVLDESEIGRYVAAMTGPKRVFQTLKRHSYLLSFVSERLHLLRRARPSRATGVDATGTTREGLLPAYSNLNVYTTKPSADWERAWAITKAAITHFRDTVEEARARFVVVVLPAAERIDTEVQRQLRASVSERLDFRRPESILNDFCYENRVLCLFLAEPLELEFERTKQPLYGFGGRGNHGHWNERGHAVAAHEIERFLIDTGLIPFPYAAPPRRDTTHND